jgi:hypothetical protein
MPALGIREALQAAKHVTGRKNWREIQRLISLDYNLRFFISGSWALTGDAG